MFKDAGVVFQDTAYTALLYIDRKFYSLWKNIKILLLARKMIFLKVISGESLLLYHKITSESISDIKFNMAAFSS